MTMVVPVPIHNLHDSQINELNRLLNLFIYLTSHTNISSVQRKTILNVKKKKPVSCS